MIGGDMGVWVDSDDVVVRLVVIWYLTPQVAWWC